MLCEKTFNRIRLMHATDNGNISNYVETENNYKLYFKTSMEKVEKKHDKMDNFTFKTFEERISDLEDRSI